VTLRGRQDARGEVQFRCRTVRSLSVGTRSGWFLRSIRDLQLRNAGSGRRRRVGGETPARQARVGDDLSSACFRAEAAVASAARFHGRAFARQWKSMPLPTTNRLVEMRNGPRRVRTSARLARVIYSFLAWRGASARSAAAKPGRCQPEEEVTMIYIRCYQSCSQPAIIPIIIIA